MADTKLLLVEDDPNLGDVLCEYLNLKGYKTTLCKNGVEGYNEFSLHPYDMCILDVMMPIMDGFTLAKKIRSENQQVPIIFLTAKAMKEDKLEGFKAGGDDYLTKPFSMEELQMRIDAVLRRCLPNNAEPEVDEYEVGIYKFNHIKQELVHDASLQKLTTKESSLLRLLCQKKNQVLPREHALKTIWGEDNYFTARSMDVFITKLRKYLKSDEKVSIINVHGKGYKLVDI